MHTAVFPGSFDPITNGHVDLINRALKLYDRVIVAIGVNSSKAGMFPTEKRVQFIQECFENEPRLSVETYKGLTVDFCKEKNAQIILRGIRSAKDLDFETPIAQTNQAMCPEIETVFLLTSPSLSHINSTIIRELIKYGRDVSEFVPDSVKP